MNLQDHNDLTSVENPSGWHPSTAEFSRPLVPPSFAETSGNRALPVAPPFLPLPRPLSPIDFHPFFEDYRYPPQSGGLKRRRNSHIGSPPEAPPRKLPPPKSWQISPFPTISDSAGGTPNILDNVPHVKPASEIEQISVSDQGHGPDDVKDDEHTTEGNQRGDEQGHGLLTPPAPTTIPTSTSLPVLDDDPYCQESRRHAPTDTRVASKAGSFEGFSSEGESSRNRTTAPASPPIPNDSPHHQNTATALLISARSSFRAFSDEEEEIQPTRTSALTDEDSARLFPNPTSWKPTWPNVTFSPTKDTAQTRLVSCDGPTSSGVKHGGRTKRIQKAKFNTPRRLAPQHLPFTPRKTPIAAHGVTFPFSEPRQPTLSTTPTYSPIPGSSHPTIYESDHDVEMAGVDFISDSHLPQSPSSEHLIRTPQLSSVGNLLVHVDPPF